MISCNLSLALPPCSVYICHKTAPYHQEENMRSEIRSGAFFAAAAYTIWGISPIYFKAISAVAPLDIVCYRIVWSVFFLALLLSQQKKWHVIKTLFAEKRTLTILICTAVIIGLNWLIFIWAVNNNHVLDASLGYYINPLINILLGMVFLGERLRPLQWFAVALATVGVTIQVVRFGSIPWVALALAISFGCYGLLRKKISIDTITGLFFETVVLLPAAVVYLAAFSGEGFSLMVHGSLSLDALLIAAGLITTIPLLCFTAAAARLRLSTLGFFQYIGPSLMFFLALTIYDEPFKIDSGITFAFIWTALALFTLDAFRRNRKARKL